MRAASPIPGAARLARTALAGLAGIATFVALAAHGLSAQAAGAVPTEGAGEAVAAGTDAAAALVPSAAVAASTFAGSLASYLVVSFALFMLGLATILVRRNALYVLMGVELILNAANLNFVAFARFGGYGLDGQLVALFVVILAAAEAAIAMAIVLRIFHDFGTIDITRTDSLRD